MIRQLLLTLPFAAFALLGAQPGSAAEVEQVFKFYCAQCHGLYGDGKGPNVTEDFPVSPRNFTSASEMNKLTDADIRNVILDGGPSLSKSPMMPPWSKTLSGEDIDALVQHLRKLCQCKGKEG